MMRKLVTISLFLAIAAIASSAQTPSAAATRFPGLSPLHIEILNGAKQVMAVPVPTWLPVGFKAEKVEARLGTMVPIEEKTLVIIYSRKLSNGQTQRFSIEAGFDGLGGLPYDLTKTLQTPVGSIDLMYEPPDLDDSRKKTKNFAMTEWFKVGKTDFHYNGRHGDPEGDDPDLAMISLADTEKILKSLRRY